MGAVIVLILAAVVGGARMYKKDHQTRAKNQNTDYPK